MQDEPLLVCDQDARAHSPSRIIERLNANLRTTSAHDGPHARPYERKDELLATLEMLFGHLGRDPRPHGTHGPASAEEGRITKGFERLAV